MDGSLIVCLFEMQVEARRLAQQGQLCNQVAGYSAKAVSEATLAYCCDETGGNKFIDFQISRPFRIPSLVRIHDYVCFSNLS